MKFKTIRKLLQPIEQSPIEQSPMSERSGTKAVGPLSPKISLFSPKAAISIQKPHLVLDDKCEKMIPDLIFPPTPYRLSSEEEFKSSEDSLRSKMSPENKFSFQNLISKLSNLNGLTSRKKEKSPVSERFLFSPRRRTSSENEIGSFSILISPRESYKSPTAEKMFASPLVFSPVVSPKAMIILEKNLIADISKRILNLRGLKISFNEICDLLEEIETHLSDLTNKSIQNILFVQMKVYEMNCLVQKIESRVDFFIGEYDSLPQNRNHEILYDKLQLKIQNINKMILSLKEELGGEEDILELNQINSPMQQEYKAV